MSTEFDPYREALVVEHRTVWPADLDDVSPGERRSLEQRLHADPAQATQLNYERLHSGFCRTITVTADDLARVK